MAGAYRVHQTLANVTNGADATNYYYVDMREVSFAGIQLTLSGGSGSVTCTLEATCQDGDTMSSLTYQDVTSSFFGVSNVTATSLWLVDQQIAVRALRVKVVASTGGANDGDWRVDVVKKH